MKRKRGSLYIGKIAGTEMYIHWSFLILIFFVYYSSYREGGNYQAGLWGILFILAVFACVTLHEFGHILVAKRYDCPARNITLYPIGGIATIEKIPEKPIQEFWMALAGPWVNVIISAILFLIISWEQGMPEFGPLLPMQPQTFLYNLMVVNITLAIFNMIPAFPMDGGRVLRSLLAMKMNRLRATKIAARVGQGIAILFIIGGLFTNFWLVIIGIVVIMGASGEAMLELNRATMADHRVKEIIMHQYTLLHAEDTLDHVMHVMLDSHEKVFVVDIGDGTYGTITGGDIVAALQSHGKDLRIGQIMNRNVLVLDPGMQLNDAYHKMMLNDFTVCPVMDNGRLVGILDLNNINEFVAFSVAAQDFSQKSFA